MCSMTRTLNDQSSKDRTRREDPFFTPRDGFFRGNFSLTSISLKMVRPTYILFTRTKGIIKL